MSGISMTLLDWFLAGLGFGTGMAIAQAIIGRILH